MKYLFTLLLTGFSMISLAQEVQKPAAPKPPKERRHMIVLDGVKTWGVGKYTIVSAVGTSRYYNGYGMSVGYRYSLYKFLRLGVNFDYNAHNINKWTPTYTAGIHVEVPIPVSDKFFIGPNIALNYDGVDDIPNGKFRTAVSLGVMYKVTKSLAINFEPGYSYYKPLLAKEYSVRLGLRFLF